MLSGAGIRASALAVVLGLSPIGWISALLRCGFRKKI
jgi:hypothetical protein